jgi:hypothetical protein
LNGWETIAGPLPVARAYWRLRLLCAVDGDRFIYRMAPVDGVAS